MKNSRKAGSLVSIVSLRVEAFYGDDTEASAFGPGETSPAGCLTDRTGRKTYRTRNAAKADVFDYVVSA